MNCEVCGKTITAKRKTRKTCSDACRSKAYNKRKATQRLANDKTIGIQAHMDLNGIAQISPLVYERLKHMQFVYGSEIMSHAMDIAFMLLSDCGHVYDYNTGVWSQVKK